MSKKIVIGEGENGLYIEIYSADKKSRKRSNRPAFLQSCIDQEAKHFIDAKKNGEDLVLYTATNDSIVLKNAEHLKAESLLGTLWKRLENAPIVADNMKKHKRSSFCELVGLRLLYVNKTKLAALALAGTVLVVSGKVFHQVSKPNIETSIEFMAGEKDSLDLSVTSSTYLSKNDFSDWSQNRLLNRLEKTVDLQENYDGYDRTKIMLGARVNPEKMEAIYQSDVGKTIIRMASTYGVDPYLLLAKGLTESNLEHEACCPNGNRYNGYGVGAFQLETPDGRMVTAWNYEKGCEDSLSITMDNATNFETNVQAAAMYLQNRMNYYNGNVYLALQSYNYGQGMMKLIIHDYAKQKGITEEEVKNNLNDLGWLAIVEDVHQNPNKYYYRVMLDRNETDPWIIKQAQENYVWNEKTYGNDHYIVDVLSYYVGTKTQNKSLDGTSMIVNLSNNEIKQVSNELEESSIIEARR